MKLSSLYEQTGPIEPKNWEKAFYALDKEWQVVLDQKLGGLKGRLWSTFTHDVDEAIRSLDRPTPNAGIALVHLRRMKQELDKLQST
ncbi:MAG: hypothetical protein Q8K86_01585 [Candidatus Nanopelagicaceae bacterium]|nr:hypothetical protein [Candidatus Nanopelagicaceae bacterium]